MTINIILAEQQLLGLREERLLAAKSPRMASAVFKDASGAPARAPEPDHTYACAAVTTQRTRVYRRTAGVNKKDKR